MEDVAMAIMALRNNGDNNMEEKERPSTLSSRWNDIIQGLKMYRYLKSGKNNDFITRTYVIPATSDFPSHLHGVQLGRLLDIARTAYHNGHLTQNQKLILEQHKIHWDYDTYQLTFVSFPALDWYKTIEGHLEVPIKFIIPSQLHWPKKLWGMQLGAQVYQWRKHKDSLLPNLIQALDKRHFIWEDVNEEAGVDPSLDLLRSSESVTVFNDSGDYMDSEMTSGTTELGHIYTGYAIPNLYNFSLHEDEKLRQVLWKLGAKFYSNTVSAWKIVSTFMVPRGPVACRARWLDFQNCSNKSGWLPSEDTMMRKICRIHTPKNWRLIACYIPGRTLKQCRERWHNHLDPSIKKGIMTAYEGQLILEKQKLFGNKWSRIAAYLPGRTDNMVKNHWYSSFGRSVVAVIKKRKKEQVK